MSHDRNCCVQTRGAFAFSNQEAKKHPQRRHTYFYRCVPSLAASLQNKLAQHMSIKSAYRIVNAP